MIINFLIKQSLPLAILWALVILLLCAMPGQYIPSISLLGLLSFDKWIHAGMFFVLNALILIHLSANGKSNNLSLYFLLLSFLYGISLEIMQGLVFSNRSAEWQDMLANTFGCLIAFAFRKKIETIILNRSL
jgi:VanZ family protein